jgi:hypothetical protein
MENDLIEVKPGIGGVSLNLIELWRRLFRRPSPTKAELVTLRFLQLFNDHGIATAQIPRWLPAISLAELDQPQKLLAVLTPAVLEQAAHIFSIQRTWLEGVAKEIYETNSCYSSPQEFFTLLQRLNAEHKVFQICAFTSVKALNWHDDREQALTLIIAEKISTVSSSEDILDLERYHIFSDAWNWGYAKTRIQLKGMVRVVDQIIGQRVPLFPASIAEVEAIQRGWIIPRKLLMRSRLTDPSLEDYTSSLDEHKQAKETDELPYVMKYITERRLEEMARRVLA